MKKLITFISLCLVVMMVLPLMTSAAFAYDRDPGTGTLVSDDRIIIGLDCTNPDVAAMELYPVYAENFEELAEKQTYGRAKIGPAAEFAELIGIPFSFTLAEMLNPGINSTMTSEGKYVPDGQRNDCFCITVKNISVHEAIKSLENNPYIQYAQYDFIYETDTPSVNTNGLPFTDVKDGKWYYDNVKYVYENGIMNGVTDTKFDPTGTLTRGMCATIIYRMAGSPKTEAENKFTDVKAGKYYTKAVTWAQSNGIVNGKTETTFDPDGDIKRAEFATMLYRYLNFKMLVLPIIKDDSPADDDLIPSYATEAVDALFRAGVVNGREDGRFDPKAKITRAEAAAMIDRFVKTAEERSTTGDDDVLDIVFFGNSFVYVPKTPEQFKAIAEGKHKVEIYNRTHGGWTLQDHYDEWSKRDKSTIAALVKDWDVILLNEGTDSPALMIKEELPTMSDEEYNEYVTHTIATGNYLKLLTEMFGKDKTYYNLCQSSMVKTEEGAEFSEDGLQRHVGQSWVPSNMQCFAGRDWLKENCNVNRIMVNLKYGFDPEVILDPRDFDNLPEDYHPNLMSGYCHARALYCTIYNEPCAEQNNGILTDDDIPGDTPEEKAAYMVMIKNLIQEQLDFQKAH